MVFHAAYFPSYAVLVIVMSPAAHCPLYIIAHGNFQNQFNSRGVE
jgi:hypothetical protein